MMAEAATILVELGFDLIDMNLGCPVKKVVGNGEGSAMLKNPIGAEKVFRAVRDALPSRIPVTMKTRKGFQDPSGVEAIELAKRAEAAGLSAVTIHGRTQAQGYSGKSDWEAIGRVKAAVKIPVIGNGDVLTAADAKRLFEVAGVDGIMIGRGGLGNPWIYKNLDRGLAGDASPYIPSVAERKETLLKHFALVYLQNQVIRPLKIVESLDKFDIKINATGGGVKGQAESAMLGISRILVDMNPEHRPALKAAGLLKRDPRSVERKKFGHKKARKSFQFSKR